LLDTAVFQQLAGAYPTSWTENQTTWSGNNRLFVTGHNVPVAPSTDRILRAGAAATDQALTSSNTMTLDLIDYALEADSLDNSNQPIERFDDMTYDLFVSPSQLTDLKQDTTGKIQWFPIAMARTTGGDAKPSQRHVGKHHSVPGQYGTVKHLLGSSRSLRRSSADSSVITTVRRAVLVGKDALTFASPFGRPDRTHR